MQRTWLLFTLFLLLGVAPVWAQNLVVNGDFSSGTPPNTFSNWSSASGGDNWVWSNSNLRAEKPRSGGPESLTSANFTSSLAAGQAYEVQFSYGFTVDTTPSNTLQILIRTASGGITGSGLSGSGSNAGTLAILNNVSPGSYTTTLSFTPNADFADAFIVFRGTNAIRNANGSILWVDDVVVQRKVPELDSASAFHPILLVLLILLSRQQRQRRADPKDC